MKKIFLIFIILSSLVFSQGYVCLVGGGTENYNDWSDKPYSWIVEKADSGKVLVLSYTSQSDWMPNYFMSFGADTAYNKIITSVSTADNQSTYDEIVGADAVFIKGGDQWQYVSLWKGTKTEQAILDLYNNGGVISGTSAGAMIISEIVFTAENGSATSKQTLRTPFYSRVKLDSEFLPILPNTLVDTHFIERGRFGRLIGFIFNSFYSFSKDILGIGVDDRTALCIDKDLIGTVYGSGAVSFFQKDELTNYFNEGNNYSIENLRCDKLIAEWKYDLANREISFIPEIAKEFIQNEVIELPQTDFYFSGTDNNTLNTRFVLPKFIEEDVSNLALIYNSSFEPELNTLTNYFNENNINYSLNSFNGSDPVAQQIIDNISNATSIVFAGNDMQILSEISRSDLNNILLNKIGSQTSILFLGNSGKISSEYFMDNVDESGNASFYGEMLLNSGLNYFPDFVVQPTIFSDEDFRENRTSALEWNLILKNKRLGLFLDSDDYSIFKDDSKSIETYGPSPLIILDTRNSTNYDSSRYKSRNGTSTRQVVAVNNLRYTISNFQKEYLVEEGMLNTVTSVEKKTSLPTEVNLLQNYPNPFNPKTTISYQIKKFSRIELKIYDILGNLLQTLVEKEQMHGNHKVEFDGKNLSSGIYIYQLNVSGRIHSKKMLLLK